MKKYNLKNIALLALVLVGSCKQETIKLVEPTPAVDPCPTASKGSANFTKFVAIGTSYTAGFQAGALFTDGQNNSLAAILNKQFQCVGGNATFTQPTIGSALGYNIFITPNPDGNGHIFGRFLLEYESATSPTPTPQLSTAAALPNPAVNPGFIYTGPAVNNFSVEAITLGQFLIPNTGNWGDPNPAHGFSPFYARFASSPGSSTILQDAATAAGTFFMFWGGMDDFMLYAVNGGDPNLAPLSVAGAYGDTPGTSFGGNYSAVIETLLASNPNLNGVVGNFPDIFVMPIFTSVPWNAIAFTTSSSDQANIAASNGAYAVYNGGLAQVMGLGAIGQAEVTKRTIQFATGANGIVIEDETLTDLTAYGLPSIRQATSTDIIPLSAGGILGTEATPGDPTTTWGVGKALTDQYALIPSEIIAINSARAAFNTIIATAVQAHPTRLGLADVNTDMGTLVAHQAGVLNGVTITPNINPPTGIFSEDGLHPNSRGYAYISISFINAINDTFGATIPLTNISQYSATALPIP